MLYIVSSPWYIREECEDDLALRVINSYEVEGLIPQYGDHALLLTILTERTHYLTILML